MKSLENDKVITWTALAALAVKNNLLPHPQPLKKWLQVLFPF